MGARYAVRLRVRSYELDANSHLNHANYHRYGEHARAEHFLAAGASFERLLEHGLGFVLLETHVRFLRELRGGDEVEIDSRVGFGTGKTFTIDHTLTRADGVVACEIACRLGLIDSVARRLVADPAGRLREIATDPAVLGL
ncbi:MAG: acyl-CoA thioesterase [Pseudonocardia sp.]